jgi:hypothetical protein
MIPWVEAKSALSYGGTTTRMVASVDKDLIKNLNAKYKHIWAMDYAKAGFGQPDNSIEMNYRFDF